MHEVRSLPRIAVLATGGTIAGAQAPGSGTGYVAGTFGIEHLLDAVPQLSGIAALVPEQVANVGSQDMQHTVWYDLAERVRAMVADPAIAGIVVTHGTDTLEETAYFLDLVVPADKPVVVTGAMRPATAPGADGPGNLYAAVGLAAHPDAAGRGTLIVVNEEIHHARSLQKIAAAGVSAFASWGRGLAGVMRGPVPKFHGAARPMPGESRWRKMALPAPDMWPRVGVVYAHADMQSDVVEFMAQRYRGLVLAGVGGGNATEAALQALAAAVARGVPVVRASRTGSGHVGRNVEVNDDALGFVAAGDLAPAKARVLLMLGLMSSADSAALQHWFDTL